MAKLKITQVKSRIGATAQQRKNLDALGLRKIRQSVEQDVYKRQFLERLIAVALPRIRDFKGINEKFDGQGNYEGNTLSGFDFFPCLVNPCLQLRGYHQIFTTNFYQSVNLVFPAN